MWCVCLCVRVRVFAGREVLTLLWRWFITLFSLLFYLGHRKYQEDTVQVLPLPNLGRRSISPYAAVFDGHGGSGASELCRDTVHTPVVTEEAARPELSVPLVMSRALRQAGAKFTHTPRRTVFRVYGTLAVSRAVGDKNLQPMARSMNSPLVLCYTSYENTPLLPSREPATSACRFYMLTWGTLLHNLL